MTTARRCLLLLLAALLSRPLFAANTPTTAPASQPAAPAGYLFITYKPDENPDAEQLYFALSQDGFSWFSLNNDKPLLTTTAGERGARAPYLLRTHDNKFVVLATDLSIHHNHNWTRASHAGSKSLLLWQSDDLVKWSEARLIKVAPDDAGCLWAPEAIYDEQAKDYLVFWASTTSFDNFSRQRILACRTKDFQTFSKPFTYMDRSSHVIDLDIVRSNGKYYRFFKDDTFKSLVMETSDALNLPWRRVTTFALANTPGYERPECFPMGGDTWCLYADFYPNNRGYRAFTTTNLAAGQFTTEHGLKLPFAFQQGSILPLSPPEYARVRTALDPAGTSPALPTAASHLTSQPATREAPETQPAPPATQPQPPATQSLPEPATMPATTEP